MYIDQVVSFKVSETYFYWDFTSSCSSISAILSTIIGLHFGHVLIHLKVISASFLVSASLCQMLLNMLLLLITGPSRKTEALDLDGFCSPRLRNYSSLHRWWEPSFKTCNYFIILLGINLQLFFSQPQQFL